MCRRFSWQRGHSNQGHASALPDRRVPPDHTIMIPFFKTQMGKGSVTGGSGLYMGTAALSERDYTVPADSSWRMMASIPVRSRPVARCENEWKVAAFEY
jgi:hypothetical protein